MHDIVGIILIALFFASFIGTCASLGRTTQPPPPGPDKPED